MGRVMPRRPTADTLLEKRHLMMTRCLRWTALIALLLPIGCRSMSAPDSRSQGQRRWSDMRGRVQLQLATQQYEVGVFEDTVRTVTESLTLNPDQPDAYVLLAKANLELGKSASAARAIEAAGRAGVDCADLHYLRGVILEQRDELSAAVQQYDQARKLDWTHVDALIAQAECLVGLDRPSEAFRLLEEQSSHIDDDATVSALAAHIATLIGEPQEAYRNYGRALEASGGSRLVAEELGRLLVRSGRYEEALSILTPLTDSIQEATGGAARRALATCHLVLGNPGAARAVLEPYAGQHPDDTLAQLLLAKAALAENDMMTALRAIDLVQQREPERPELWLVRATVRWKRGKLTEAAADLYDVLQNDPNDVEAHCLLGEVLREKRKFLAARTHFERALEIDRTCAWATAGMKALRAARRAEPIDPPEVKLTSVGDDRASRPR